MNINLILLALAQGLFLTNNIIFIAVNGLVGLSMAPVGWMATLPVMGYVVGGAASTSRSSACSCSEDVMATAASRRKAVRQFTGSQQSARTPEIERKA